MKIEIELPAWDPVDSYNTSTVDTDFTLDGNIPDLTNYKEDGIITCRVYQQAV